MLSRELGHYATEYFPFTGYVSFNRSGRPGFEDLVVMISVEHSKVTATCGVRTSRWATTLFGSYGEEFEFDDARECFQLVDAVARSADFIQNHEDFIIGGVGSIGKAVSSS